MTTIASVEKPKEKEGDRKKSAPINEDEWLVMTTMSLVDPGKDKYLSANAGLPGMGKRSGGPLPPPLDTTMTVRSRRQYLLTTAGLDQSCSFTINQLLGSCGVICTVANSTVVGWASSLKLKRLKLWPAVSTNVGVRWASSLSGFVRDTRMEMSLPTGTSIGQSMTFKPPGKALVSDWVVATSSTAFTVVASAGTVLEIDMLFTLSNVFSGPSITVAAGTQGSTYYLGFPVTTAIWTPVGVTTTQ